MGWYDSTTDRSSGPGCLRAILRRYRGATKDDACNVAGSGGELSYSVSFSSALLRTL